LRMNDLLSIFGLLFVIGPAVVICWAFYRIVKWWLGWQKKQRAQS